MTPYRLLLALFFLLVSLSACQRQPATVQAALERQLNDPSQPLAQTLATVIDVTDRDYLEWAAQPVSSADQRVSFSLEDFDRLIPADPDRRGRALAATLAQNPDNEMLVYDALLERFADETDADSVYQLARARVSKARLLLTQVVSADSSTVEDAKAAIAILNPLTQSVYAGELNPALREVAGLAMLYQGLAMRRAGEGDPSAMLLGAILTIDKTLMAQSLAQMAMALFNSGRSEDGKAVLAMVVQYYGLDDDPQRRGLAEKAKEPPNKLPEMYNCISQ